MKKLVALVLTALMLIGCCAFAEEAAAPEAPLNLLANPGFETGDFTGKWLNYYHYDQIEANTLYAEIIEGAHTGTYAAQTKSAMLVDGASENEWWLSALGIEATEAMKAAGNGEYFFKAFVKLAEADKFANCDAWLYIYEQGREEGKYDAIQVWKLESNTPVDSMGWNEVGYDADGNEKSFQLWWNKGADRNGKEPTQQPGAREILVDDFEFTHAILWITCGMDGAVAMTYQIDDAQLFVKPVAAAE